MCKLKKEDNAERALNKIQLLCIPANTPSSVADTKNSNVVQRLIVTFNILFILLLVFSLRYVNFIIKGIFEYETY